MIRNFEEVTFENIAWSDTSSRTTMRRVPPLLRLSVREVGVLNPLIMSETQVPDRFAIITGWLRFQAAREVGENSVPCHIYRSFPPKILLLCSLFDNLGHRHMNAVEQSIALKKLSEYYTAAEIKRTFLPILNIHESAEELKQLTQLADLPEDIQWAIVDGDVNAPSAVVLEQIPHGHRQHVLRLFRSVRMGDASQLEAAHAFRLLLQKKDESPLEILREERWIANTDEPVDRDTRVEQDLLSLEVGLAAVPTLFAARRNTAPGTTRSRNGNYLAPGAKPKPSSRATARKKPEPKPRGKSVTPTESGVLESLQRRLGKLKSPVPRSPRLPAGAKICAPATSSNAPHRLEVNFSNSSQLCDTLKQLLDAEERGALQAMLQRR